MSYESGVYIGISLEVMNGKKDVEITEYVNKLGRKMNTKFNPDTGEEYEQVTVVKQKLNRSRPFSLLYETQWDEQFWTPEYCYSSDPNIWTTWLLNIRSPFGRSYDIEKSFSVDLMNIDGEKVISEFKETFSGMLDYLTESGLKYKINYSVISYAH